MNKQTEAGILIAVAVLMTMSATTMYHSSSTNENSIDHYLTSKLSSLNHWVKGKFMAQNTVDSSTSSPVSTQQKVHEAPKIQASDALVASGGLGAQNQTSTNSEDAYKRLGDIGVEFVDSMSQKDWQTLLQALTKDNASEADTVLTQMVNTHIPNNDRTWIINHFQGSQNFSQEDVSLLQKSIKQAESELTPEEKTLISQLVPEISPVNH